MRVLIVGCLGRIHTVFSRVQPLPVVCETWPVDQIFHTGKHRGRNQKCCLSHGNSQAALVAWRVLRTEKESSEARKSPWHSSCAKQSHRRRLSLKRSRFSTTSVCSVAQRICLRKASVLGQKGDCQRISACFASCPSPPIITTFSKPKSHAMQIPDLGWRWRSSQVRQCWTKTFTRDVQELSQQN